MLVAVSNNFIVTIYSFVLPLFKVSFSLASISYVISVGDAAFAASIPVILSNLALIDPAFSTITIYVAVAPGYCKFTSKVADNLSPATTADVLEVTPTRLPSLISEILTFQLAEIFAVPLIVKTCAKTAYPIPIPIIPKKE